MKKIIDLYYSDKGFRLIVSDLISKLKSHYFSAASFEFKRLRGVLEYLIINDKITSVEADHLKHLILRISIREGHIL